MGAAKGTHLIHRDLSSSFHRSAARAEKTMIPRNENDITYRLHVRDAANQEASSPSHAIPVEQKTVQKKRSSEVVEDKEIDRYNLILFDFGSTDLSQQNREIVDFIRARELDSQARGHGCDDDGQCDLGESSDTAQGKRAP